jgi:hypothetical protein
MKVSFQCCVVASILLISSFLFCLGCRSEAKTLQTVSEKIEIKAKPETVFEAIRKERNATMHNRHLVSIDGAQAVIQEDLENVPLYGKVNCLWQEKETPFTRVDYILLKSDKFKAGFGSWVVKPCEDKEKTILELSSYMDTGSGLPFASELTRMAGHGNARKRLEYIKSTAEALDKEAHLPPVANKK